MAHFVIETDLIVGRRIGVRLAAGGIAHARHILVVNHGMHAIQIARFAVIDIEDAGVGMGAGQQLAVEHAAHFKIIDEGGIALGQLEGVDFDFGFADHFHFRHNGGHDEFGRGDAFGGDAARIGRIAVIAGPSSSRSRPRKRSCRS